MNEFLGQLQEETGLDLSEVKLKELNVDFRSSGAELVLICPQEIEKELRENIPLLTEKATALLKTPLTLKVKIVRSYFDETSFCAALMTFFSKYAIIKNNVKADDVSFNYYDGITATVKLPAPVYSYIQDMKIDKEVNDFVFNGYCEKITVKYQTYELAQEITTDEEVKKYEFDYDGGRVIKVDNVREYIGDKISETPIYISDIAENRNVVICGTIISMFERSYTPKKYNDSGEQRPMFKFVLKDYTGSVECLYFPRKSTGKGESPAEKMRNLGENSTILVSGVLSSNTYNGKTTVTVKANAISLCDLPQDFVLNREKMLVPDHYSFVKPKPYSGFSQSDIFHADETPEFLLGKKFVVFDLETTGLTPTADMIIEIGAVKIENGRMTETFSTLVNPQRPIPQKNVELTGISDSDVKDSPLIKDVLPDFYKFCDGCTLVGQNSDAFDVPFLKVAAERLNIYFENDQLDVMILAQKYFPHLKRFNLAVLSKYFDVVNEAAHRAVSDAETTAKIFIKIAEKM